MERKPRLLVVEDEAAIRNGLVDVFLFHGYQVEAVGDGPGGLHKALSGHYDLVLLDVMLPGLDGFQVCERIREHDRDQPLIMLTARGSDEDVIRGLSLGADDYVAKPFSVTQLVLRVQAVLRRTRVDGDAIERLRFGNDAEVDLRNLCGRRGGEPVAFTRREIALLRYLASCRRSDYLRRDNREEVSALSFHRIQN
jgi:two-component system response regulator RegX3